LTVSDATVAICILRHSVTQNQAISLSEMKVRGKLCFLPLTGLCHSDLKVMSNKKRRSRQTMSEAIGLGLSNQVVNRIAVSNRMEENQTALDSAADSMTQTGYTNQRNGTGWLSYLKANLWLIGITAFLTLGALGAGLKYLEEDAARELAKRASNKGNLNNAAEQSSVFNKLNPFLPTALPAPTPQLSKELIYAGSRLLSVEDANASAAPPADLAIWRPSSGEWWVMGGQGSQQVTQAWGLSTDKTVPGDYDGDGKTDFSVYRQQFDGRNGTISIRTNGRYSRPSRL
jgi:hypothetical protein